MSAVLEQISASTSVLDPRDVTRIPGFGSQGSWELANRIGKAFAASTLVPEAYRDNVANCIIALEMANRMGASPLLVMQNLYIVHGNPGWSSKFLIACFNQCGRFSALRYEWSEKRDACRAWAIERATGERIEGPQVSTAMAAAEGWSTKSGSKWKTMPELMLMYRAAAFLIRTYAPEISMGMSTDDELVDTSMTDARTVSAGPATGIEAVRAAIAHTAPAASTAPPLGAKVDPDTGELFGGKPVDTFDAPAFMRKLQACTDVEALDLMGDEIRMVPEGVREELSIVYKARRSAIAR